MKKKMIIISLIVLVVIGALVASYFLFFKGNKDNKKEKTPGEETVVKKEEPKLKIIDVNSSSRPVAVMINNHDAARKNHSGLQDAYLVYEMIVEGGLTRYMAVFKDQATARIGSVRSSRHYFLDYAMENDAIYVHFGWSPYAQSDISKYGINNINGLYDNAFWRDESLNVDYEHTAFTNIEKIKAVNNQFNYRSTSTKKTLLSYSIPEVDLSKEAGAIKADTISINYSYYINTSYQYDEIAKVYKRFVNDEAHMDAPLKKQYTAKNIITYQVNNYSLDNYGRQDVDNVGSGEGYYISNGYAVPITWSKTSRDSQTVYKYKDGREINVNDGNTFIQIQPRGEELKIAAKEPVTPQV